MALTVAEQVAARILARAVQKALAEGKVFHDRQGNVLRTAEEVLKTLVLEGSVNHKGKQDGRSIAVQGEEDGT
jgi:hypothetical protein